MNEAWNEDSQSLRAEVRYSNSKVQALLRAQQPRASTDRRWRVQKYPIHLATFGITLAAVSALYGAGAMDACFIDQQGALALARQHQSNVADIRSKDQNTFSIDNAPIRQPQRDGSHHQQRVPRMTGAVADQERTEKPHARAPG